MIPDAAMPDLFHVTVIATRPEAVAALLRDPEVDFGCRPSVRRREDGSVQIQALATEAKVAALRGEEGLVITVIRNASQEGRRRQEEVGQGDRFGGGRIVPRGFGEKAGRRIP